MSVLYCNIETAELSEGLQEYEQGFQFSTFVQLLSETRNIARIRCAVPIGCRFAKHKYEQGSQEYKCNV